MKETNDEDDEYVPNTAEEEAALDNDFVSQLFNKIDWDTRIRQETHRDPNRWLLQEQFEKTHMYKYLWYKTEPEQIDLNNPFDIEPGNQLRPLLGRRKKKRDGKKTEMNMMTEGLKEVKDEEKKGEEDDDDDDFLDEYGNIKPKGGNSNLKEENGSESEVETKKNPNKTSSAPSQPPAQTNKDKRRQRKNAKNLVKSSDFAPPASYGWNDLDSQTPDIKKIDFWKKEKQKELESSLMFPRLSNLNYYEQENFLILHANYMKGELFGRAEQTYLNLLALVQEERQEFMAFAREMSNDDVARYNFILAELERYTTEHRSFRIKRIKEYPRYWSKLKDVRLTCAVKEQGDKEHFLLRPAENLLELGTIPKANVPKPKNAIQMPTSYSRLINKYPTDPSIMPGTQGMSRSEARKLKRAAREQDPAFGKLGVQFPENKFINKTCITKDPNAQILAVHYVPDLMISASALKCIMDNFLPKLDRSWEIPVVVQTFDQVVEGKLKDRKTVVFIGKPFLSKAVTAVDRNRLAFKNSLKTMILQEWNQGAPVTTRREAEQFEEDDLFGAEVPNLDDLETFGDVHVTPKKAAQSDSAEGPLNHDFSAVNGGRDANDKGNDEGYDVDDVGDVDNEDDNMVIAEDDDEAADEDPFKLPDHSDLDDNIIQTDGVVSPFEAVDANLPGNLEDIDNIADKVEDWFLDMASNDSNASPLRSGGEARSTSQTVIMPGIAQLNGPRQTTSWPNSLTAIAQQIKPCSVTLSPNWLDSQLEQLDSRTSLLHGLDTSVDMGYGLESQQGSISQLDGLESSDSEDDLKIDLNTGVGLGQANKKNQLGKSFESDGAASDNSNASRNTRFRGQKRVPVFTQSTSPRSPRVPQSQGGVKSDSSGAKNQTLSESSDSSSEEELLDADDIIQKKLDISRSSNTTDKAVQEAHKAGLSSSDSEEELDDEDDFMAKKMGILGEKEASAKKGKEGAPSNKPSETKSVVSTKDIFSSKLTKPVPSKSELFGSGSDESDVNEDNKNEVDEEEEEVTSSPKKKVRALSSSESELEPEDQAIKEKLVALGKEKAVVSRVKKKIAVENRLELLKTREQDVSHVQKQERQTRARNRNSGDPKSSPVTPAASQISSTSSADEASSANKRATRRSARAAVAATAAEEPVSEQTTTNGSSAKRRLTRKDVFKPTEENSKQAKDSGKMDNETVKDDFLAMLGRHKDDQLKRKVEETKPKHGKQKKHKLEATRAKEAEEREAAKLMEAETESGLGSIEARMERIHSDVSQDDDEPSVSSVTPQQHSNPISKPHVPSGAIATPNVSSRGEKSKFYDKSDGVALQSTPSSQPSGILDSLLSGQSTLLGKEGNRKPEQPRMEYHGEEIKFAGPGLNPNDFVPPAQGGNVSYRLWNLWDKEKPNSNIRMIIRSKVAGFSPEFGAVVPSVKLEYQAKLGVEMCSLSQYAREWIDNIIRPGATTIRSRLNPATGDISMLQPLSLKQLTEEGRVEQLAGQGRFDPAIQLGNIHNLASELRKLPAGQYLLSHDQKSGPFCRLLSPAPGEGPGVLDLESVFGSIDASHNVPILVDPWQPIDVNLVTPWHITHKRVPGTFEPCGKKPEPKSKAFGRGRGGKRGVGGRGGGGRGDGGSRGRGYGGGEGGDAGARTRGGITPRGRGGRRGGPRTRGGGGGDGD